MRLDINGTILEVADVGDGEPVLLLHGWPDSHEVWRHQITALGEAGYRTIAPDLRGFGQSDKLGTVASYGMMPEALTASLAVYNGHRAQLDAPGQVNALLLDFLTSLPAPTAAYS